MDWEPDLSMFARELRLVLACLRLAADGEAEWTIARLSGDGVDWAAFIDWIERHRVAPQVYGNLRRLRGSPLPDPVLADLRQQSAHNAKLNMAHAAAVVRLVELLQRRGVSAMPFKGIVAALQIYGDLARRAAGDIDLLVAPGQVERADAVLLQAGYRRVHPDFALTPRQQRQIKGIYHHFRYVAPGQRHTLELHWDLLAAPDLLPLSFDQLAARAQALEIAGRSVAVLGREDMALYLFAHGAYHGWYRLSWLCDLGVLAGAGALDAPGLAARGARMGLSRILGQGMLLTHTLLASPLPALLHPCARTPRAQGLARHAVAHIADLVPLSGTLPAGRTVRYQLLYLPRLRRGVRYKIWLGKNMVLRFDDWRDLPLPTAWFPLYYLLRPFLWALRRLKLWPRPQRGD